MTKKTKITCACGCGKTRLVNVSDVKRGWGLYYNRDHKSRHQVGKVSPPANRNGDGKASQPKVVSQVNPKMTAQRREVEWKRELAALDDWLKDDWSLE